jgi:hypothetical protein
LGLSSWVGISRNNNRTKNNINHYKEIINRLSHRIKHNSTN